MMRITLNEEADKVIQYIEIAPRRVTETFNDAHCGIIIPGNPMRVGAVHWFPDQIVFALARATEQRIEDDYIVFEELEANLVLELRDHLPCGPITPEMEFDEILNSVAESFGLPVSTHALGPASKFHFEGPFDGEFIIQGVGGDDVFFQGDGILDEGKCWYVWAFSFSKYRNWFSQCVASKAA